MTDGDRDSDELAAECRGLAYYICGEGPSPQVIEAYARGHASLPGDATKEQSARLDRSMVVWAQKGPIRARSADAYARIFRPTGLLRRKLILVLAVLECTAPYHRPLHRAAVSSPFVSLIRLAAAGIGFSLALLLGIVRFAIPHLLSAGRANAATHG